MTLRTWLKVAWRSSEHLPWWLRFYRVLRWCPWKLAVLILLAGCASTAETPSRCITPVDYVAKPGARCKLRSDVYWGTTCICELDDGGAK